MNKYKKKKKKQNLFYDFFGLFLIIVVLYSIRNKKTISVTSVTFTKTVLMASVMMVIATIISIASWFVKYL